MLLFIKLDGGGNIENNVIFHVSRLDKKAGTSIFVDIVTSACRRVPVCIEKQILPDFSFTID